MTTPNPEDVQVAAGSLAWTMLHFRELLDDEGYAAALPHFQALADALPDPDAVEEPDELAHPADPAFIAAMIARAESA